MYPPGRVIFIRPLKQLVGRRHRAGPRRLEKGWDAVWVTPKELIAEGILISGKVRSLPPHACILLLLRAVEGLDAVWVTPKELIAEGILISGKVRTPPCTHAPPRDLLLTVEGWDIVWVMPKELILEGIPHSRKVFPLCVFCTVCPATLSVSSTCSARV